MYYRFDWQSVKFVVWEARRSFIGRHACVKADREFSDDFAIGVGVRQGCCRGYSTFYGWVC